MPRPMTEARKLAKETNARFFIGPPCAKGHDGERYTSTNACRACVQTQARPDRIAKKPRRVADEFEQLL